jgi:hypothetical protein
VTAVTPAAGLSHRAQASQDPSPRSAGSHDPGSRAPVVVLGTAHAGSNLLRFLLDQHPDLACTAGTGILPLCEQAIAVWRSADGRPGGSPSPLAVSATRALSDSVITSVLARTGKRRWCEVVSAMPDIAETFLQLYPGARFLCLHRACPGFIRAVLDASPWGIADPLFAPFSRAYPANTVAALTAYWVTQTASLLALERAHPQAALRIRFEDLTADEHATAAAVMSFLGIGTSRDAALPVGSQVPPERDRPGPYPDFPAALIPPALLPPASDLLRQLDYPPLPAPRAR